MIGDDLVVVLQGITLTGECHQIASILDFEQNTIF
jgi:hypothetical protein